MGLADSFGAGVNAVNDLYRGQMLRDQLQAYPELVQAQADYAKSLAGVEGVTAQYAPQMAQADLTKANLYNKFYGPTAQANIGLTNEQAAQAGANAGLIGTEAQKNQFLLNNPNLMLSGIAGQVAGINYLAQHNPEIFGSGNNPTTTAPVNPQPTVNAPFPGNGGASFNTVPPITNTSTAPLQGLGGIPFNSAPISNVMPAPINNAPINTMPANNGANGLAAPPITTPQMFGGNPMANQMVQSVFAPMNEKLAQAQYYTVRSSPFFNAPPNAKAQIIAQTNGFGYSPEEATNLLTKINPQTQTYYTVEDLGAAKGFTDPNNWPPADPSPTPATITRAQLRNQSLAELDKLQPQLTASLAPYSQRILGFSPKQIGQAITGSDPDAQARFIAAKALTPDLNALRAKIMSAQFGIGMQDELSNHAMSNFETFEGLVSPAVYAKGQQYIQNWLAQANAAANKSIYTAPATKAANAQKQQSQFRDDDLAFTAKKYGMTVDQVKQRLSMNLNNNDDTSMGDSSGMSDNSGEE